MDHGSQKHLAKVSIYGHPIHGGDELESEFLTTGLMHRSDGIPTEGACFFVVPIDYAGLNEHFPRAHYSHLLVLHNFDWKTRRGDYFHIPYGGRLVIEAC